MTPIDARNYIPRGSINLTKLYNLIRITEGLTLPSATLQAIHSIQSSKTTQEDVSLLNNTGGMMRVDNQSQSHQAPLIQEMVKKHNQLEIQANREPIPIKADLLVSAILGILGAKALQSIANISAIWMRLLLNPVPYQSGSSRSEDVLSPSSIMPIHFVDINEALEFVGTTRDIESILRHRASLVEDSLQTDQGAFAKTVLLASCYRVCGQEGPAALMEAWGYSPEVSQITMASFVLNYAKHMDETLEARDSTLPAPLLPTKH